MYQKIKKYYDSKIYSKEQVAVFVKKGYITANQYKEITGDEYEA